MQHRVLKSLIATAVLAAGVSFTASAADAPLYTVVDGTKVDKVKNPKFVAGSNCANCALFQAKAGAAAGACPLFAGKQVAAKAWCSAWAKKA